mmetsp:Transcript_8564/g.14564  ORF Transcript_8564/g.14564 Transcript_8564/m.14564 type:complete len:247 (+) Transcript_8564:114-854(+)
MKTTLFVFAGYCQYFFYLAQWKSITASGSINNAVGGEKLNKVLLALIVTLASVSLMIFLQAMMSSATPEEFFGNRCDFAPRQKKKFFLHVVVDLLLRILFLALFLRPLIFIRRVVLQNQQSNEDATVSQTGEALGKVIERSFAGALLSQVAQVVCVFVTALAGIGFRVHALRVTTCINLLGVSLMLRDTDKLLSATSKMIERGLAQKRVYIIAIDEREEERKKERSQCDSFGAIHNKTAARKSTVI